MARDHTEYETGSRKFSEITGPDPSDEFSQEAAENKKPPLGIGLTEPLDETNDKTRHPEGQRQREQPIPSPDTQKFGAGPAIAEHSKDTNGAPGTTNQKPRWEGPPENQPRGYLPAKDDPATNRDAAGENLKDPEKRDLG
ncbi:hypothetical protein AB4144_33575, partial [Rhizobiaceae sp. 2RAB30]